MSHWRNPISGNSHWLMRMGSLEEEMLQLALEREVPQAFLKKVPDDTSDPDVHCFILSFPTRDPVNVLPQKLWDIERHCWCCTDLVKKHQQLVDPCWSALSARECFVIYAGRSLGLAYCVGWRLGRNPRDFELSAAWRLLRWAT